jgi:hypothetical protein
MVWNESGAAELLAAFRTGCVAKFKPARNAASLVTGSTMVGWTSSYKIGATYVKPSDATTGSRNSSSEKYLVGVASHEDAYTLARLQKLNPRTGR